MAYGTLYLTCVPHDDVCLCRAWRWIWFPSACLLRIIPSFFAVGYWNNTRDSIVHPRAKKKLSNPLLDKVMNREPVVHLKNRLFYRTGVTWWLSLLWKFGKGVQWICLLYANIAYICKNWQSLQAIYIAFLSLISGEV